MATNTAIPITILTGFLGSGKTTIILNLVPQLPKSYKLALLKNEFGDVAIDSQLASSSAISGVRELLNGCICCNLVGQLGDALETLRTSVTPDRIIIETSGSAFPATLAMEVNRLARETGHFVLDGVVSVIDVENWEGYEDTSITAKMQAQYTDLIIFNKHELVDERRFDDCLDRVGDLEVQTAWVKSDKGKVAHGIVFGIDGALAKQLHGADGHGHEDEHNHRHDPASDHSKEVEVLSATLEVSDSDSKSGGSSIDLTKLEQLLSKAPKDEIYRIKAVLVASSAPKSSTGEIAQTSSSETASGSPARYILNWAFGRWTFTAINDGVIASTKGTATVEGRDKPAIVQDAVLRMTIICARYQSTRWRKRIEDQDLLALEKSGDIGKAALKIERIS